MNDPIVPLPREQWKGTVLPIGYTAQNQISRETYDALTPLQKQDALLDGAVLEETGLLPEAELTGDTVSPAAEMELDGVQQLDETTYYAPQDGGRITRDHCPAGGGL